MIGFGVVFGAVGKISVASGEASIQRGTQTIPATTNTPLEQKDVINTKEGAKLQVILNDSTVITIGAGTTVSVDEYVDTGDDKKVEIGIAKGVFKSITGQIGKANPDKFKLETRTTTIGIRGTTIAGNIQENQNTIACTDGAAIVTEKSTGVTVELPAGSITQVTPGAPPAPPRAYTPQDLQAVDPERQQAAPVQQEQKQEEKKEGGAEPAKEEQQAAQPQQQESQQQTPQAQAAPQPTQAPEPQAAPVVEVPQAIQTATQSAQESAQSAVQEASQAAQAAQEAAQDVQTTQTSQAAAETVTTQTETIAPTTTPTTTPTGSGTTTDAGATSGGGGTTTPTPNESQPSTTGPSSNPGTTQHTAGSSAYTSWGYWSNTSSAPTTYAEVQGYWVNGTVTPPSTLQTLIDGTTATTYTYTQASGGIIGYVSNGAQIVNGAFSLGFDFGSGTAGFHSGSSFQFNEGAGGSLWKVENITGAVTKDGFSGYNFTSTGAVTVNSGEIKGSFFGSGAEAIGGSFKLNTTDKSASGAFSGIR